MNKKTNVIISVDGEPELHLSLSDEQIRLLKLLYDEELFWEEVDYQILDETVVFKEV